MAEAQSREEQSGKQRGFAYLWFCSSSALVHLYSPPKAPGMGFKCVKALCVQEDELGLQTHTIPRFYHCVVFSLPLQPSFSSPAVQALSLFLTLLISTLSNILPHFLQISFPPFGDMEAACMNDLWAHQGQWQGGIIVMDAASVTHQSSDTDVSDAEAEILEVHLNSAKLLPLVEHMWVCACVHTPSRRLLSVKLL